jgi:hypothetical protein
MNYFYFRLKDASSKQISLKYYLENKSKIFLFIWTIHIYLFNWWFELTSDFPLCTLEVWNVTEFKEILCIYIH